MYELYKLFGKVYNNYDLPQLYLHFVVLKGFNRLDFYHKPAKVIFPRTVSVLSPWFRGFLLAKLISDPSVSSK